MLGRYEHPEALDSQLKIICTAPNLLRNHWESGTQMSLGIKIPYLLEV